MSRHDDAISKVLRLFNLVDSERNAKKVKKVLHEIQRKQGDRPPAILSVGDMRYNVELKERGLNPVLRREYQGKSIDAATGAKLLRKYPNVSEACITLELGGATLAVTFTIWYTAHYENETIWFRNQQFVCNVAQKGYLGEITEAHVQAISNFCYEHTHLCHYIFGEYNVEKKLRKQLGLRASTKRSRAE